MIRSRMKFLRLEKEEREGRKLTIRVMVTETGLSNGTIQRVLNNDIEGVSMSTVDTLCKFFGCKSTNDLMEYVEE